jgi:hypothetical protein
MFEDPRKHSQQSHHPDLWKEDLIASVITVTHCDRRCPHCCMQDMTRRREPHFVDPDRVYEDIVALGDVKDVRITGGETTLHPEFLAVAECARIARGERHLSLFTNGARLLWHQNALRFFDQIYMSIYDNLSNAGTATDLGLIRGIRAAFAKNSRMNFVNMKHTAGIGGRNPCDYLLNTVSVFEGRVYPCCVASGIDGAQSTELGTGWVERLLKVPAPCERCVFSI